MVGLPQGWSLDQAVWVPLLCDLSGAQQEGWVQCPLLVSFGYSLGRAGQVCG